MPHSRPLLLATVGLLVSSCGASRIAAPVDTLVIGTPGTWSAAAAGNHGQISSGWLASFNDAELNRTVDEALTNNRNLKVAAARLRQAEQSSIIARSRTLPSVGMGGGTGLTDRANQPSQQSYNLSLSAGWEPDLWGRLRDLTRAAEADEQGAVEDYRGARLSLAANTAKAWCNLISAEQEVNLAQFTLNSFQTNLRIIERVYVGTGEGALDIQFGRTNVSSAQRTLEQRLLEREEAARNLELLLGRYPGGAARTPRDLPKLSPTVPAGIPADLVERRPDLSAARARLFASARRADASRKQLLPSFSITTSAGTPAPRFSQLLSPDQLVTSIAGSFSQNLLDGGALAADARSSVANNEALIHQYSQLALQAFREVESAIAAGRSLAAQETFLAAELEQAVLAERQADRDYSEGVNPNILSVLEAQRRANNARASMIRLRNQRLQNRIDLHLALGGDFRTPDR
jgi:outer membrane protein, multidrug efflux system